MPEYRPTESVLHHVGFGRNGVRSGTVASWLQSFYRGVVPRRGWFAVLQKWGKSGGVPWQCRRALKIVALILLFLVDEH
ncbi:hypothetical protein MRX96_023637 [Rhipicephalus microplus]